MECQVCLQNFDSTERRPKVLPCGHSFCLRCLQGLHVKKCPLDNKAFDASPSKLMDNYSLMAFKPVDTASLRFWCLSCKQIAPQECVEQHPVCSLKKARAEDAERLLEGLQRGVAAVDELAKLCESLEGWRGELQAERVALVTAKGRLQDAQGADEAVWDKAKQDAAQAVMHAQIRS
ncbi:E3 ubiquitin-protein ligase TRIM32-like [Thrips palmi]|uniref:E3 ubiquitin-protein ligase TRIM32-like n=1 Tax=Thrips palmi TaxID=161013 RepID=A0A6P8YAG0_THRPL|nr:E3 ubiquitin-protein ligase TRIM32-like [Thrips palmi]